MNLLVILLLVLLLFGGLPPLQLHSYIGATQPQYYGVTGLVVLVLVVLLLTGRL